MDNTMDVSNVNDMSIASLTAHHENKSTTKLPYIEVKVIDDQASFFRDKQ